MQIPAFQPKIKASAVPFEDLAANKNIPEKEKVTEACKQFEAVLLRQILKDARKDVLGSKGSGASGASAIYDDMITDQLADSISRSGSFGLAQGLEKQLVHQVVPRSKLEPSLAEETSARTTDGDSRFRAYSTRKAGALSLSLSRKNYD